MYFNTILGLFLAALAAAAPSHHAHHHHKRGLVTFIMTEPDCDSLRDYCKNCSNDDLNCETDPRCEWCYENNGFGDGGDSGH